MNKIQTVELVFESALGKIISFELDEQKSKELVKYIKEEGDCRVLFPDYEDE